MKENWRENPSFLNDRLARLIRPDRRLAGALSFGSEKVRESQLGQVRQRAGKRRIGEH